jgi:uncharacterized protein
MVNVKLLEKLVCPVSKSRLMYDNDKQQLIAEKGNRAYPIKDGIPIMLPDQAEILE